MYNSLSDDEKKSLHVKFYNHLIEQQSSDVKKTGNFIILGYCCIITGYILWYVTSFGLQATIDDLLNFPNIFIVLFIFFIFKFAIKSDVRTIDSNLNNDTNYNFDSIKDLLNRWLVYGELVYSTPNFYLCKKLVSAYGRRSYIKVPVYSIRRLYSDEDIINLINEFLSSGKCSTNITHRIKNINENKYNDLILIIKNKKDDELFDVTCKRFMML